MMNAWLNLDPNDAYLKMRRLNRASGGELVVLVEGPEEGKASLMLLREAVDAGFFYEWA
jgi:hypothetical protein